MKHRIGIVAVAVSLLIILAAADCGVHTISTTPSTVIDFNGMNLSQINQDIQQRTVQFVFVAENATQYSPGYSSLQEFSYPAGTGILVNDAGYVITANHLIDIWAQFVQQSPAQIKKVIIVIPSKPEGSSNHPPLPHAIPFNDFDIVARDEKHDLVLLKMDLNSEKNPTFVFMLHGYNFRNESDGSISVGDACFSKDIALDNLISMTGYSSYETQNGPEAKTGKVTSGEIPEINTAVLTDSVRLAVSSLNISYIISDYYQTDITSNTLFSGSPVYYPKNGAIIGMCINLPNSSGVSVIIPSRYILDLLKNNNAIK